MRMRIIAAALTLSLATLSAPATQFLIESSDDGNLVKFLSTAPMESFEGKTDRISGSVEVDFADLGDDLKVEVRVDLASLDTGLKLRNRHMRDNHLETDQFPEAVFRAERFLEAPATLAPGDLADCILDGEMNLHGISRAIQVPVSLRCGSEGDRIFIDVESEFEISLPDYEIKRPKFLILKLNETQEVSIRLRAWEVAK